MPAQGIPQFHGEPGPLGQHLGRGVWGALDLPSQALGVPAERPAPPKSGGARSSLLPHSPESGSHPSRGAVLPQGQAQRPQVPSLPPQPSLDPPGPRAPLEPAMGAPIARRGLYALRTEVAAPVLERGQRWQCHPQATWPCCHLATPSPAHRGAGVSQSPAPRTGGKRWGRTPTREPAVSRCPQNRPHPAAMLMFGGTCFPHLAPIPPKCPCGLWELAAHTQPLGSQPIYPPFFHGTLVFPVSPPCQAPPPPGQPRTDVRGPRQLCGTGTDVQGTAQLRKALCPRSCAARCRRATPCMCATPRAHTALSRNKRHTPCNTFQRHEQRLAHVRAKPRAHMRTYAQPPLTPPPAQARSNGGGVAKHRRRDQ